MPPGQRVKQLLRDLASFTIRERRGILWFIPIIIVISLVIASLSRPRFESSLRLAAEHESQPVPGTGQSGAGTPGEQPPQLFDFDPNTIDYRGLRALGFTSRAAAGILKFRESGKVFRIREDFAACWDVGDSIFYALEPYIVIGSQFAVQKRAADAYPLPARDLPRNAAAAAPRRDTLFWFDPNTATLDDFRRMGFSARQAQVILDRREQLNGFRSPAEFEECYVVRGEMADKLRPYMIMVRPDPVTPAKPELNTADSAALTAIHGIGPLTAGRIVAYRARLGGFVRAEQLAEVQGMTEGNYAKILQQILVDDSKIQKIDINFATPEKLSGHPYISPEMMRKILKNRQLKGGWSTTQSMINDGTITEKQAEKLAPYLLFTPISNN